MLARTHITLGLLTAVIFSNIIQIQDKIIFFSIAALTSLLPDIDHKGSTINRVLFIFKPFTQFMKHRGFFHSIWPILIAGYALTKLSQADIMIAFVIGYSAHLIGDALTKHGVNFLYPLTTFKLSGFIKTGGTLENLAFMIMLGAIIFKMLF